MAQRLLAGAFLKPSNEDCMQELVDEYLTMLQVESGCAANTLAAYRRDLRKLVDFFQQEGMTDLHALTKPLWMQISSQLTNSRLIFLIDCPLSGVRFGGCISILPWDQRKAVRLGRNIKRHAEAMGAAS